MLTRICITIGLVLLAATAIAGGYYFQKPDWPAPDNNSRMLIYDPVANADKNVTWWQLRNGFKDMSTAAKLNRLAPVASTGNWMDILNKPAETCVGRIAYDGNDGSQIYVGSGAPLSGSGILSDFYLNSLNGDYYRKEGATPAWVLKGNLTGAPGTNGKTYSCTITGGVRTVLYTALLNNPAPVMTSFAAEMRENGIIVTPATYSWSVPASLSLLSGSSSAATFTPAVASTFSAGAADNRVDVTLTYSGQTCKATAEVAITRIGDTGSAGSPDTKTDIYNKIKTGVTGDVMRTQCGPGDAAGFACLEWRDPIGNIILTYTAGGGVTIYNLPSDIASTIKLTVKKIGAADGLVYTAGGVLELH